MSRPPRVSVHMATYNVSRYLEEALRALDAQTFGDFEVIVLDDGSTDDSAAIAMRCLDPRVRVVRQENRGVGATRRRMTELSRGEFIAVADPDDLSLPDRLARQVAFLDAHPEHGLVGGHTVEVDEDGEILAVAGRRLPLTDDEIRRDFPRRVAVWGATCMFRRRVVEAAGGYRPQFKRVIDDDDLVARVLLASKAANLAEPVIKYRLRRSSGLSMCERDVARCAREIRRRFEAAQRDGARTFAAPERALSALDARRAARPSAAESAYLFRVGRAALRGRAWSLAAERFLASIRRDPANWRAYTGLLRAALRFDVRA